MAGTAARGMYEIVVADVNADMGKRFVGMKKQEVAGLT